LIAIAKHGCRDDERYFELLLEGGTGVV